MYSYLQQFPSRHMFFTLFQKNTNLEVLDLSWNGLYIQGAGRIGLALTKNQTLKDLDLSCNRLSEVCLGEFLKGLSKNTTLQKLRVRNVFSSIYETF